MCRHELRYAGIKKNTKSGARIVQFKCIKCRKLFSEELSEEEEFVIKREMKLTPEQRLKTFFKLTEMMRKLHKSKGV
jgi:hypothetical protein